MAGVAYAATAFSGLCVGISVAAVLPFLLQSSPGIVDTAQLDPSAHIMLAGVASFFTAITMIYDSSGGGDRRIREVMFLILCTSVGILSMYPGPVVQARPAPVLLGVAAVQLLPYAGAATFYLPLMLTYVHVRAGAGGGNERYRAAVELLNTTTVAATVVTGVLGFITTALVFNIDKC